MLRFAHVHRDHISVAPSAGSIRDNHLPTLGRQKTMAANSSNTVPPQIHHSVYRSVDGYSLIELQLREIRDLFNTLDPAPFHTKDLKADAEEYIVGAVHELGLRRPVKMLVYLPEAELAAAHAHGLIAAIHNYFSYRMQRAAMELRQLFVRGSISLTIGLLFMILCLFLRQAMEPWFALPTATVLQEGLLILGWVAMWRPIEIFLYDWWPIWRQQRVYRRVAELPIELAMRPTETRANV